jgi:CubicO group peptidase (beta-lactamase class C family)
MHRSYSGVTGLLLLTALISQEAMAQVSVKTELPTARPESVGISTERLKRINETVKRFMDDNRISGAVTLVARKGRIVHFETQGVMDIDTKKPMRGDTLFAMASTTKPVTGVAIMMLIDEGKIQLTDLVSKFIPEFRGMKVAVQKEGSSEIELVAAERGITIRDLLTHTSGLATGGLGTSKTPQELRFPSGPNETLASYIPRLATIPLDFQPGSRWRYSGLAGIDVLARVVEVASGQSFDVFLRQRIFEPLGMKNTFFVVPDDQQERLATIYQSDGQKMTKSSFTLRFPKTYFCGAGGLISTAEDFYRFGQMLCNKGQFNGKRLLSPRAIELMSSNHVGDMFAGNLGRAKGMGFGLTVEVVEDSVKAGVYRTNGSFGWDGAFGTHFWVDPKNELVAVLMIQLPGGQIMHKPFETAVLQSLTE